jgi:hypothetical protein
MVVQPSSPPAYFFKFQGWVHTLSPRTTTGCCDVSVSVAHRVTTTITSVCPLSSTSRRRGQRGESPISIPIFIIGSRIAQTLGINASGRRRTRPARRQHRRCSDAVVAIATAAVLMVLVLMLGLVMVGVMRRRCPAAVTRFLANTAQRAFTLRIDVRRSIHICHGGVTSAIHASITWSPRSRSRGRRIAKMGSSSSSPVRRLMIVMRIIVRLHAIIVLHRRRWRRWRLVLLTMIARSSTPSASRRAPAIAQGRSVASSIDRE